MDTKKYYLAVFLLLVAAIVLVIVFTGNQEDTPESKLPPGHPEIGEQNGMPGGEPGKGNVRSDFMHQLTQLQKKVDAGPKDDTTDVLTLARMLFDSHQIEESIPYFQRYIAGAPNNDDAKIDLSVAYYELQKLDNAVDLTNQVLKRNPKNTTAQYNLGILYRAQGEESRAKEVWNKLIKNHPDSPDAARAKELMTKL